MVKIPCIKIPSVRVGSIGPTSNIGAGGATPAPPTPITYLTQWRMMGNSVVHTDEYLTQWKVEGNSVVDNNAILSCGDLGQDGKYHVKISNGVTIYDIPLTEPLRKVGSVADTIEFVNGVATLTRNVASIDMSTLRWNSRYISSKDVYRYNASAPNNIKPASDSYAATNILCAIYTAQPVSYIWNADREGIGLGKAIDLALYVYDSNFNGADMRDSFVEHLQGVELIYELATPTTEVIQVSPFPISATDTYTSANDTPYSAFEHTENKEIWSCGEYNATDGKYHILVQPQGGSIADIALTEPLRKTGNTADTLEYPTETSGKALLTIRVEESGGELSPLVTPITELVDAPQIEEAESYTCVISQGAKAVSWSSFETNRE